MNKEIQKGSDAKSYMRKGFPIYEKMRKYLVIYGEAVSHIWLCSRSLLNFLTYEENILFFFNSATSQKEGFSNMVTNSANIPLVNSFQTTTFLMFFSFYSIFSQTPPPPPPPPTGKVFYSFYLPEGVCTDEFLSRKPGFRLSAMHRYAFRWFSASPLVFMFLGLLPLQLNQIWRIFCVMYGEEGGWTLLVC